MAEGRWKMADGRRKTRFLPYAGGRLRGGELCSGWPEGGLPFHHANIVIIIEISPTSNFFPLFSQNNSSYNVVVAAVSYK